MDPNQPTSPTPSLLTRYWYVLVAAVLLLAFLAYTLFGGRPVPRTEIKAAARNERQAHADAAAHEQQARAAAAQARQDSAAAARLDSSAHGHAATAQSLHHQTHTRHATPVIPRTRVDSVRYYNELFAK